MVISKLKIQATFQENVTSLIPGKVICNIEPAIINIDVEMLKKALAIRLEKILCSLINVDR